MRPRFKSRVPARSAMILGSFIFGSSAVLAAPYSVTDGADSNTPGTLRYGLNNGETEISIDTALAPLGSPLTYNGLNALTIHGNGATVSGGDFTLLEITQGADLAISSLDFEGPGGYSVHPAGQGGGKGIFVEVPLEREGVVSLILTDVTVKDVGDHGVHVSDCDIEGCGAGGGGGGDGSSASVYAWLDGVEIDGVGFGHFDADGLRVDERGDGDIYLYAIDSAFNGVGADGVELDEGDNGNVVAEIYDSTLNQNGAYCAPIDPEVPPYDDPTCVEDDDGDLVLDLDDGIDIDEAGDGDITVTMYNVVVNDNFDEGLDFDEAGEGNVKLELAFVHADANADEGVKADEENAGNIIALLNHVTVTNTRNNDGIQMEAADAGQVLVQMRDVTSSGNDGDGAKLEASGGGQLHVQLRDVSFTDNDGDGAQLEADKGWVMLKGDNDFSGNGDDEINLNGGVTEK